jgi:hypothetical protein
MNKNTQFYGKHILSKVLNLSSKTRLYHSFIKLTDKYGINTLKTKLIPLIIQLQKLNNYPYYI